MVPDREYFRNGYTRVANSNNRAITAPLAGTLTLKGAWANGYGQTYYTDTVTLTAAPSDPAAPAPVAPAPTKQPTKQPTAKPTASSTVLSAATTAVFTGYASPAAFDAGQQV